MVAVARCRRWSTCTANAESMRRLGTIGDSEHALHDGVTVVANGILLATRAILLCKRRREKLPYPGCWGLPGGHLEWSETPEQALVRELREELGVTPTS